MTHLFRDGPAHLFDHQVGCQSGYQTAVTLWLKVADLRWGLFKESKLNSGQEDCMDRQISQKVEFYRREEKQLRVDIDQFCNLL